MRLSAKQKSLFEEIAARPKWNDKPGCLYIYRWSRVESFYAESDLKRFLKNMEERGLIRIENYSFIYPA